MSSMPKVFSYMPLIIIFVLVILGFLAMGSAISSGDDCHYSVIYKTMICNDDIPDPGPKVGMT